MNFLRRLLAKPGIILSLLFFVVGVATLPDYGINWDTINHLPRGQAYLHFLLTGKTNYSGLPASEAYFQDPGTLGIKADKPINYRSYYQMDGTTFDWFMSHDGVGHPPLSDILSSLFNRVLFGKLKIVNDIDSYRIYGILLAAVTVGVVGYWISKEYGTLPGLVASLSLSLYPLFWSESHFNTEKDVPETAFWTLFVYSIYRGIAKKEKIWLLISGLFFGLALATKFNILFAALVVIPWILSFFVLKHKKSKEMLPILGYGLIALFIGIVIFIGSWPYLWPDVLGRLPGVFKFYETIGTARNIGFNFYATRWIFYTTPVVTLVYSLLGILYSFYLLFRKKDLNIILFGLWLLVPILRVSWPGSNIYGGIRQIMEYIPALAIFSGLGMAFIQKKFKFKNVVLTLLILLSFAPIVIKLIKIHPNENVYFNFLAGGLTGAREMDIPSWGNSFGAPYRKGIEWLNQNAPSGSKVVYAYELLPNSPMIWFRPDLIVTNKNRSGYLRKGEYAMTLTYDGTSTRSYYDSYLENFLNPVFEERVDNVAVLKIWRNDETHLKQRLNEKIAIKTTFQTSEGDITFDAGKDLHLSKLEINYDQNNCRELSEAFVEVSPDGDVWNRLPGNIPGSWRISDLGKQPDNGYFIEPFVGQEARFIRINLWPSNTCLKNIQSYKLFYFVDLNLK